MSYFSLDRWYKSRKALIAWKTVCSPKNHGGLKLIDLEVWNRANLAKLLWNLSGKSDSLWVKWIHEYYLKNKPFIEADLKNNSSWIIKAITKKRNTTQQLPVWIDMQHRNKFSMRKVYLALHHSTHNVVWRTLLFGNVAQPRAVVNLWIDRHNQLLFLQ